MISPLTRGSKFEGLVLGFDTEYESKGGAFLCAQLSDGTHSVWSQKKLTVHGLAKWIAAEYGAEPGDEIILVSFFSIAELQFMPVKTESFGWREYGSGSLDVSFHDERTAITIHVFDIARFFDKQSLAKVADSFGFKKLSWKRDQISRADLKKPGFKAYALNDAILARKIVDALRNQFEPWEIDPLAEKTAASTAAAVFRRGWVDEEVKCDENRARLAGMLSCWGGRAEAFSRGAFQRVYEYDLSSAYPRAAIALGEMPCAGSWSEVSSVRKLASYRGGLAQVRFRFPDSEGYPCLPLVTKTAQLYPLSGTEWVTFAEIAEALAVGCKIEIIEGWGYKKGTTILRDYMEEILEKRAAAKGAQKVAFKLLANSLIGKLAQRVTDIDINKLREASEKHGIQLDDLGSMRREELAVLGIESAPRVGTIFMPEWNSLITGHVRARIGVLARLCRAVYVATDAVWSTRKLSAKELRAWPDLELKRQGPAVVARTRLGVIYDDDENPHVAQHSIWNRKAALECLGDIDGRPLRYKIRRPVKLRESMQRRRRFGEWIEEERSAEGYWDDKRELAPNGRDSRPWGNVSDYERERKRAKLARTRSDREAKKAQASSGHGRSRKPDRKR